MTNEATNTMKKTLTELIKINAKIQSFRLIQKKEYGWLNIELK